MSPADKACRAAIESDSSVRLVLVVTRNENANHSTGLLAVQGDALAENLAAAVQTLESFIEANKD